MSEPLNHITVLLNEAVDSLVHDPDGVYVDCTFGRGGHSQLILDRLSDKGRLIAIDKDPEAIAYAHQRFGDELRFEIEHGSFAQLDEFIAKRDLQGKVAGVLMDLGVSSPQLDDQAVDSVFSLMVRWICAWTRHAGLVLPSGLTLRLNPKLLMCCSSTVKSVLVVVWLLQLCVSVKSSR